MGYVLTEDLSLGQLVFTLWSSSTKVSDFKLATESLLSAGAYVESRGEGGGGGGGGSEEVVEASGGGEGSGGKGKCEREDVFLSLN